MEHGSREEKTGANLSKNAEDTSSFDTTGSPR